MAKRKPLQDAYKARHAMVPDTPIPTVSSPPSPPPPPEDHPREHIRFSKQDIIVLAIATLIPLGGYRVEDPWIVWSTLFISWILFIYLCVSHSGKRYIRLTIGVVITVVLLLIGFRNPESSTERKLDTVIDRFGLTSLALKNQLTAEFTLGWDMFTVDLHALRATERESWSPQNDISNPHRTQFIWTNAGGISFDGARVVVGLPAIVSGRLTMIGNSVCLRREVGVSLQTDVDPDDSGGIALFRGNTLISDVAGGKAPFLTGKNPKITTITRILSITDAGIVMVLGLKPYR
jgi:hypothetical protein